MCNRLLRRLKAAAQSSGLAGAGARQQELASEQRVSRLVEEVRRSHKKKMIPKANFIHFLILPKVSTVPKKKKLFSVILLHTNGHQI